MNPFPLLAGQRITDEPGFGRLRVVGAVRLSKYTDASTSPEVQTEFITEAAGSVGGEIVGWANDVDISALKTTPWEREQLNYWLEHPEQWDVLVWQRMDRAVRSMADMADLGRYAKKHGKRLIFASGPGGGRLELDFSSPMSELIMLILAFAAQLEGQTIMERNRGAAAHLQSLGRWAGGIIPYGTIPVRKTFKDGNEGWWLARDVDLTWNHVVDMVGKAIAMEAYTAIRDHLNQSGAITPKNHRARLAKPPRDPDPDSRWRDTTVREILTSQALRGYLVKEDGSIVRDVDGKPIMQGEPLIDDETWFRLQEALKERAAPNAGTSKRKDAHPLLGVIMCGVCDRPMYASWVKERRNRRTSAPEDATPQPQEQGRRYLMRCKGDQHPKGVAAPNVPVEPTLEWVDQEFMNRLGMFRRTEVVTVGGVDNRAAIAELKGDIEALSIQLPKLRGAAADTVATQLNGMSDELKALERTPLIPPQRKEVDLGRTWGEDWTGADWRERRTMLLQAGVVVTVGPPTGWRRPVGERLTFDIVRPDPEADALEEAAHQAAP
ncbi:recombinase family protein [Streptomyces lydicus]|uniref:recombinase family protein n=1 Tax=Streptomyces lydicus TaxID=47763 RepID=UPI0037BA42A5